MKKTVGPLILGCLFIFPCVGTCNLLHGQEIATPMVESLIKDGDKCPDLALKDTLMASHSLSSLRGKYVYIDVWAEWCYPCRKQLPHLKSLEASFAGKNIAFLGISVDKASYRWFGGIKNLHLKEGLQWWDSDGTFTSAFQVDRIPRCILIDPEGRVARAKMTLPSDPETQAYLKSILK